MQSSGICAGALRCSGRSAGTLRWVGRQDAAGLILPGRSWIGASVLRRRLKGEMAALSFGETMRRAGGNNATTTAGRSLEDEVAIRKVPSVPAERSWKVRERPVRMSPR